MDEMYKYKLFLGSISELGFSSIAKMLLHFENEKNIYEVTEASLLAYPGLTKKQKDRFLDVRRKYDFEKCTAYLNEKKINVVFYGDKYYPEKLKNISNPPYQLFYCGKLPEDSIPSVAIIGARMCSNYGYENAKYFSEVLSSNGIQIISGMASGIDGISQKTALDNNGKSFGVLGSGVDICYPKSNQYLYNLLKEKGGIISEFPPGTKPASYNFPVRNRIISGLSDILLVVEAKEKSGTSITVTMALEQGKDVYAIPGKICDSLSAGCNKMIKEGAGVALSPQDLLNDFNIRDYLENKKNQDENYSLPELKILKMLEMHDMYADEMYYKIGDADISELKTILFELILKGVISEQSGRYSIC